MRKCIVILMALFVLLLSSCTIGSRRIVTETRAVSDFDEVIFEGIGELDITQGDRESLTIEAESNVMRRIITEVRGGTLHIRMRRGLLGLGVVPTKSTRYDLTMKDIRSLDLSGVGTISAEEIIADDLHIDVSGAGSVGIDELVADGLTVDHSGLGKCEVAGRVERQSVDITGAGEYDGSDLEGQIVDIRLSGLGRGTVWANERLDIELSGAGTVRYYGDPRVTQDISGVGSVRSLGDR